MSSGAIDPGPEPTPAKRKPRGGALNPPANVESAFGKGQAEIKYRSRETKDERLSRLKLEEDAKAHERRQDEADKALMRQKDLWTFKVIIALVTLMTAVSLLLVVTPGFPKTREHGPR